MKEFFARYKKICIASAVVVVLLICIPVSGLFTTEATPATSGETAEAVEVSAQLEAEETESVDSNAETDAEVEPEPEPEPEPDPLPVLEAISSIEFLKGDSTAITPELFIASGQWDDSITVAFSGSTPSTSSIGHYTVTIVVSDDFGQSYELTSKLSIYRQNRSPVISGVADQTIFAGSTISYRSGVYATDSYGVSLTVNVDSSQVDIYNEGEYTVVYSATDSTGAYTSTTATIRVSSDVAGAVSLLIDDVFAEIFTDGMSDEDRARAIYTWCKSHIVYASSGSHVDMDMLAYAGLTGQPGDCYTYYSLSYRMYQRAGIAVTTLERIEGTTTNHKWVAINLGYGWYHVDTCPTYGGYDTFMLTDTEAQVITDSTDVRKGFPYYYYVYRELPEGITIVE